MKVSYVEDLANRNGPESCGAAREGGVEALIGGRTGRVLSREIYALPRKQQGLRDADACGGCRKAIPGAPPSQGVPGSRARSETPCMYASTWCGNRGDPTSVCRGENCRPCREVEGTYADDERTWEVGPCHRTGEVAEPCRGTGSGGDGGKGTGRRELARAQRAPDAGPGKHAQSARAGTARGN